MLTTLLKKNSAKTSKPENRPKNQHIQHAKTICVFFGQNLTAFKCKTYEKHEKI